MSISYSDVLSGKAPYCHASGACFAKRESVKNDGMICVACREMGFKYIGFEIDDDYYRMAKERLDAAEAQVNIFDFM